MEKSMSFGKTDESMSNAPDDTAILKDIAVGLWRVKDRGRNDSFRFSFSRLDQKGNVSRSFKPEHLPEFAGALYGLANAFAKAPSLDAKLRKELSRLAFVLDKAAELMEASADVKEPGQVPNGGTFG
jgi:hypothetical protein